ncbi:hypothetical protein BJX62DRAFT_231418 [Aspergillus germanicus]
MLDKVHLGGFPVGPGDDYLFHAGEIHGHNVVIATFAAGQRYGTSSATSLAIHVKKFFPNLWFGLLVGVAAGLPNLSSSPPRDIRLGDVIVAYSPPSGDPPAIVPYGLGKQKGGSAIGKLKAERREAQVILDYYRDIPETAMKFPDPGQGNEVLYLSHDNLPVPRQCRPDAEHKLRDRYNVIGLEMEAAGIMNEIPVGNIRGACLRDWLIADPEIERGRIEATKGGLLDDSFRWVLGNAEFQRWRQDYAYDWDNQGTVTASPVTAITISSLLPVPGNRSKTK